MGAYHIDMARPFRVEEEQVSPLMEPAIVPTIFISGTAVEATDTYVQVIAWEQLPGIGGAEPERRLVARLALPSSVARALQAQLKKALEKGGNH